MSHTFHRYKIGDEPVAGYRLTDHLGAGGFGEVWKANAPGGTEVALKIIDLTGQQGVQEFSSLRVVKKVRHPNLISLQAFWMKDEEGKLIDEAGEATSGISATAFAPDPKRQTQPVGIAMTAAFARPVELIIAMQLGAMSLHKRLEDCREQGMAGVPVAELLEYLEQAARGIDFLNKPIHDLGKGPVPIVHGDVKPHNILVVGDAAVVCDFGLARAVETLRKTSMAPVTVAYAAPESFKGKVTPTSDQYSLAITYVELRTGRLPFDENMTPYQVMEAHVLKNLDFSRLPEPERQVIERGVQTNPEERWPSSRDLILALRQAVAQTGELPLRPGEAAYSGGPTPTHSITARPKTRDTDLPTRVPVDPHKETMHPGGHTPSHGLSLDTAAAPPERRRPGDPLAETSMLGAGAIGIPAKKSKLGYIIATAAAALVVAGLIVVPKLLNNGNNLPTVPGTQAKTTTSKTPDSVVETADGGKSSDGNETAPTDGNTLFIRDVQKKIKAEDFDGAMSWLLDKTPRELPGYEKEALQKRLHDAYLNFIDSKIQSGSYARAIDALEDAKSGIGLTDADKQQVREKIRVAWLAQANDELQNDQAARALETAGSILKRFDGDRDAQFVIARAYLRQKENAKALAALNKLGATADLRVEYQPMDAALLLLVNGSAAASPADWTKLVDNFLSYTAVEKATPPPPNLTLNTYEREQVTLLRDRIIDNVQSLLKSKTLPADQSQALVAKLEQLGSSAELEMFKVKTALDAKQFDEARKLLATVSKKIPADDTELKSEVTATGLLIDLRDPATRPDAAGKLVADSIKLLGGLTPAMRNDLCCAAEALALGPAPATLDTVIDLTGRTRDLDPGDAANKRMARLLAARLQRKAAQTTPPTKEELPKLVEDCEEVEQAGVASGTVEAFHAECLLLQDSRDRQLLSTLIEKAKPVDAYTQFVEARVLRNSAQPDWAKISELLTTAYGGDPSKLLPGLDTQFRKTEAAKMLTEAALKKRVSLQPGNASAVLANPFGDAKIATEAFRLLELAARLSPEADLAASQPQQRELLINRALAAAWKTEPDEKLANSLCTTISTWSDTDLGTNAFPALWVVFHTHQTQAADQPTAVKAAQRLIELFQKQFPVADPQATEIYKQVLQPVLALADGLATGKTPPAELDKFYEATAEFIKHYQRAKWPFADKQKEIETLISKAIKLNGKVAKYYTTRGVARVSQTPPNVEGALADAADAQKIDPNFPAAYALEGHALIYRSRQQPSNEARTADLEKAVAKCKLAVEKSKPEDKEHSMDLLNLSMAQLEKGNMETDQKAKKDLLHDAKANAEQAVELEKDRAYPDYAYSALGNALEDLAWLVGEDPEENYKAAMAAFSNAVASNPSACDPLVARARCYYKALVDSKLNPQFLGRTTEEAFQAALDDLKQAQQLNPAAVEPSFWEGKIDQQLGKYADADTELGEAVKLAEDNKVQGLGLYLVEWTRNAVMNRELSDEDREKLVKERTQKLIAAPSLGGSSNAKQAALLIAQSLLAQKTPKIADALKTYDAALADYDKSDPAKQPVDPKKADGADISLLSARAYCRLSVPKTDWNATALDSVLKDAARIIQLKPGPGFEALADWYSAYAKFQTFGSTSPTFALTPQKKIDYLDGAIADVRKAIELMPNDPGSWQWRQNGAAWIAIKITLSPASVTPTEANKKLAAEARQWMDDAIDMAGKRPDLSGQMANLQRTQQQVEKQLTDKGLPRT